MITNSRKTGTYKKHFKMVKKKVRNIWKKLSKDEKKEVNCDGGEWIPRAIMVDFETSMHKGMQ